MSKEDEFHAAVKELREKFPMVYIESWTPEDFETGEDFSGPDEANWEDPAHVVTVAQLERDFDATLGTNWDRVHAAIGKSR